MARGRCQQCHSGKPAVWEKQKSGKKLPEIHILCICAPFVLSFIQISSVSFCCCMPSSPSSYNTELTTGLAAQRGTHGAHISRVFRSAGETVVGFSSDPSIHSFRAAQQKTRAVSIQQSSAGAARQSLLISEQGSCGSAEATTGFSHDPAPS